MTVALSATAGVSKRRATVMPPKDDLTITFSRGFVDAGRIAHREMREDVGVRVDSRDGGVRRAILRASLPNIDANTIVRIDGITLRALPVVIDTRAEVGAMTPHHIEIEVPVSAPEGALMTSIVWEAETP
jgi:hypothetical protein